MNKINKKRKLQEWIGLKDAKRSTNILARTKAKLKNYLDSLTEILVIMNRLTLHQIRMHNLEIKLQDPSSSRIFQYNKLTNQFNRFSKFSRFKLRLIFLTTTMIWKFTKKAKGFHKSITLHSLIKLNILNLNITITTNKT